MIFFFGLLINAATIHASDSKPIKPEPLSAAEMGDAGPLDSVSFGSGISFTNKDNSFSSTLRFRIQNRADFFINENSSGETSFGKEWQVRRARLRFNGHVVSPRLRYLIQLSFSRRDQDWDESGVANILRDATVIYDLTPNWQIGFGQGKLPGNRQRVVSSGDLQFVDRSTVNAAFNIDRDFGFQTQYAKEIGQSLSVIKAAITSGEGRNRNARNQNQANYVARIEHLPMGAFSRNGDYFESDLVFESSPKLSLGFSVAVLTGAARANGTTGEIFTTTGDPDDPLLRRTQLVKFADLLFKYRGYSAYLEYAERGADRPVINSQQAILVGRGYNLQFGRMISARNELAVRHSAVLPKGDVLLFHSALRDWAMVYNHFLNGHRVKLQAELGLQEGQQHYGRLQLELGI